MKKKQIIIISAVSAVLIILAVVLVISLRDNDSGSGDGMLYESYAPEFMNDQEKTGFNLPKDSKIQVLMRSEDGQVDVYKVIREDNDIEYDIEDIRKPRR